MHKIWETSLFCSCQTEDDLLCIVCEIQSDTPPNILQLSDGQIAWEMSCDRFNLRGTQSFSQGLVRWVLAKSSTEFSQVIAQVVCNRGGKKKIFTLMRDSREETQRFPVESCRSCVSLLYVLFLGAMGGREHPLTPALPRHPTCSRQCSSTGTGTPYPTVIHHLCQQRGVFWQTGQAMLEESIVETSGSLFRDHLMLEQIAGICMGRSGPAERWTGWKKK